MTDTYGYYVDGEWRDSESGDTYVVVNPADGSEVVGTYQYFGEADANAAVEAAAAVQDVWADTPAPERGALLQGVAKRLDDRKEELTETLVREPMGVAGLVTPWNSPIAIPAWKMAPALATGNPPAIKPATNTPNVLRITFEALEVSNGVDYGLSAGILTENHSEVHHYVDEVDFGVIKVNEKTTGLGLHVPFGGMNASSSETYREQGEEGMDFFTTTRTIDGSGRLRDSATSSVADGDFSLFPSVHLVRIVGIIRLVCMTKLSQLIRPKYAYSEFTEEDGIAPRVRSEFFRNVRILEGSPWAGIAETVVCLLSFDFARSSGVSVFLGFTCNGGVYLFSSISNLLRLLRRRRLELLKRRWG